MLVIPESASRRRGDLGGGDGPRAAGSSRTKYVLEHLSKGMLGLRIGRQASQGVAKHQGSVPSTRSPCSNLPDRPHAVQVNPLYERARCGEREVPLSETIKRESSIQGHSGMPQTATSYHLPPPQGRPVVSGPPAVPPKYAGDKNAAQASAASCRTPQHGSLQSCPSWQYRGFGCVENSPGNHRQNACATILLPTGLGPQTQHGSQPRRDPFVVEVRRWHAVQQAEESKSGDTEPYVRALDTIDAHPRPPPMPPNRPPPPSFVAQDSSPSPLHSDRTRDKHSTGALPPTDKTGGPQPLLTSLIPSNDPQARLNDRRLHVVHPEMQWARAKTGSHPPPCAFIETPSRAQARSAPELSTPSSRPASSRRSFAPSSPASPSSSTSVRCAGFTKTGQPCKRQVKAAAPVYRLGESMGEPERRFCKDHVRSVCAAKGFYWRGRADTADKWIDFDGEPVPNNDGFPGVHETFPRDSPTAWIPADVDEQTKTLLRLTMESPLTDKECAGYIYVYELRGELPMMSTSGKIADSRALSELQSDDVSHFKVGRTDNVPRRLDQWSKRGSAAITAGCLVSS